jgi:hypothetical protein
MRSVVLIALLIGCVATAVTAFAQAPDPDKFTPAGYRFCGWRDLEIKAWQMTWTEELAGAFLRAFARNMTCRSARRNVDRLRYSSQPPYKPTRRGYRCSRLQSGHEYEDGRCVKRSNRRVAFRWQTGA